MPRKHNPIVATGQEQPRPLGNAALKVYLAVAIKTGKSDEAHKPAGGWAAYASLPDRSVRHALSEIRNAGLSTRSGGAVILDREGWDWTDEDVPNYVRVPRAILSLPPDLVRAWLALLSLADWKTGAGAATETTIGRRMRRSRCRASVLVNRLAKRGLWRRTGARTWLVAKHRPRAEPFAMVPHFILETAFGFDFRTRAEVENEAKNSADPAEFEPDPEDENSANSAEFVRSPGATSHTYIRDVGMKTEGEETYHDGTFDAPTAEVIDFAQETGNTRTPQAATREHHAATREQKAATREHISRTIFKNLFHEPIESSRRDAPTSLLPCGQAAGMFEGAA